MTDAVSYRVERGVAWLTIERPEARNALNAAAREGLYAGVRRFNEGSTAQVLVLTARRAYEIGLVNEVVPLAELRLRTQQIAMRIAANAPLSVLAAKRTAYLSRPDLFDEAERIWAPVYHSADAQEGPAAFRDKRPPAWTGR